MSIRTENIQTTISALNDDFSGRTGSLDYNEQKSVHIHRRNRAYVWNQQMQESLLDSILKGYYVPPIICCSRIISNIERREVMEGGNRITTFRRILQNEVRELTPEERAEFIRKVVVHLTQNSTDIVENKGNQFGKSIAEIVHGIGMILCSPTQ